MKKLFTLLSVVLACAFSASAQEKCLTEIMFREEAEKNPALLQQREQFEEYIHDYVENTPAQRAAGVVRIIPVVVHVVHYGGPENISDEQILNQIDILNQDFRRLNPDTNQTPAPFKAIAADSEIEFQLAKLDPQGNCTNGIVRIYNSMTYNARDNVKSVSYWPSTKYLNIWIVNSISNTNGSPGQVIGYAQFPGGNAATDGIVIKHDYMGAIGTANASGAGRTTTHEVGHWLSLRHIWGDDGGSCSGSDFVSDTPNQADWTLSICPTFPRTDVCTSTSPGILFSNYMDYTNGDCQNIFTNGQKQRFNATLTSSVSGRNNLYSAANLLATGITGGATGVCAPKADFSPETEFICEGSTFTFRDWSWGADVDTRVWSFPGGNPSTDTSANPVVTYSTPGTYDVTLTVTNAQGSTTKTVTGKIIVSPSTVTNTVPFTQNFESGTWPFADYAVNNTNGATSSTWAIRTGVASQGSQCLWINNSNNSKGFDEFITPAFNLSNVTSTVMTFDIAYAPTRVAPTPGDKLTVYYSTNCGQTWTPRLALSSSQMSTIVDSVSASSVFVPTASQWTPKTVNLATFAVSTKPNVRFKFEFNHDSGNNIYIDNINLNGIVTSVDEINAQASSVNVYPNPSAANTYVDFSLAVSGKVAIDITDLSGRIISRFSDELPAGDHQYTIPDGLDQGVYMVHFNFGSYNTTKRVVIR
jgi:PKD repeat protein